MSFKELLIPTGYRVLKKQQKISTNKARSILLSGKKYEYSSATNNHDGTATIEYSLISCPYCESKTPLKVLHKNDISKDEVIRWSSDQLSMLSEKPSILILGDTEYRRNKFTCPCCGKTSNKSVFSHSVTIERKSHKIKLSHNIENITDLMNTPDTTDLKIDSLFDCRKAIVFNLKNGHTYMQIECNNKIIYVRDFTQNPSSLKNELLYKLLLSSQLLRKELKKTFREIAPLSFESQILTFEKLVLATRFIGYDRTFYKAIPFIQKTYRLFPGFKKIAKELHKADKVPSLYNRLKLPAFKAARRIILSRPGHLFYYQEINDLFRAVNNNDLFLRILSFKHIYYILAKLNCYPAIGQFLYDAFKYENSSVVVNMIDKYFNALSAYAIKYMSLKESVKAMERNHDKWLKTRISEMSNGDISHLLPSIERVTPYNKIQDCRINGYNFEWLISSTDYEDAGHKMNNCLSSVFRPVIAIKSDYGYVAAMALDTDGGTKITEAYLCKNEPITNSISVCTAIEKWCKKYNIKWKYTK